MNPEDEEFNRIEREASMRKKAVSATIAAQPVPVQEPFDHQQAASTALRESMNRSVVIAKNTVPTLQKRPPNCGTGHCSCVECVMEPAPVQEPVAWQVHPFDYGIGHQGVYARTDRPEQVEMWKRKGWTVQPLYTTPPAAQRQWVGLTDEEMYLNCPNWLSQEQCKVWIQQIEAKLKEKNAAAQPAVPDAITDNSESPEYKSGWNDCRAAMLNIKSNT
jgi:hypothetical protein